MSSECTAWAWNQQLKGIDKLVLLAVADLANAAHDWQIWASLQYLADKTGVSRDTVRRVLDRLPMIEDTGQFSPAGTKIYRVLPEIPTQKAYIPPESAQLDPFSKGVAPCHPPVSQCNGGGLQPAMGGVAQSNTNTNRTRNINTKETTPPIVPPLPDNLNLEAWEEFKEHRGNLRKEGKAEFTPLAQKKAINKLCQYDQPTQQRMVDASIESGWTGIFPERKQFNGHNNEPRPLTKMQRVARSLARLDSYPE